MFLPFRMTWNLQMPRTEKLGFYILFGSGWICIVRLDASTRLLFNNPANSMLYK